MRICCDAGGSTVRFALIDMDFNVRRLAKYPVSEFGEIGDGFVMSVAKFLKSRSRHLRVENKVCEFVVSAAGWKVSFKKFRLDD